MPKAEHDDGERVTLAQLLGRPLPDASCTWRPTQRRMQAGRRGCTRRIIFAWTCQGCRLQCNQAAHEIPRVPKMSRHLDKKPRPPCLPHRDSRALLLGKTIACSLASLGICAPLTMRRPPAIDLSRCRYRSPGCGLPTYVVGSDGAARTTATRLSMQGWEREFSASGACIRWEEDSTWGC
jgi:hypothetical protein